MRLVGSRIGSMLPLLMFMGMAAQAAPITLTHSGTGSGHIGLNGIFQDAAFTITAQADTSQRHGCGEGCFTLDHGRTTISIDGVGTFDFITGSRTFVNGSVVGFSRGEWDMGYDLFNGPDSPLLVGYDLSTSIGPVTGDYARLIQWDSAPVNTSGGQLTFMPYATDGGHPATFSATLSPVPEPGSGVLGAWAAVVCLAGAAFRRRDGRGVVRGFTPD